MRISSCSVRRYTIGKLPKDEDQLAKLIAELNRDNAGIDEYDDDSLYMLFEDIDSELYFDGPEFNEGDISLELDDEKTIDLRKLIEHGATVRSVENIDLVISPNHSYCFTDQQGYGETDCLVTSQKAEQLINEASQAINCGNSSKSIASNLVILTKTWSTPWEKLTMFLGITTQDDSEPDYRDHWGDGSYSMDVNSEEGGIYRETSEGWNQLGENQMLSLLEKSGISISDWYEEASQRNFNDFNMALVAGGYGFGLVPFIQEKIRDYKLTDEDLSRIKNESSNEATITACFAHALSYEPINIKLPVGCKYALEIYSPSDGGNLARPAMEQYLRENIDIRIEGINYRDESGNLHQYGLSYDCTECMVNFSVEQNTHNGGCVLELKSLIISIPIIENYDLNNVSFDKIPGDGSYESSLRKWKELRDAATRGGCIDIVGITVKQRIEFMWLKP